MESILIKTITVLIALIITAVSSYVMQYLRTKLSENEMEMLKRFIKVAVMCANQIYTPEEWKIKKQYVWTAVEEFLNDHLKIKLTADQLDLLIEGIVNEVKNNDSSRIIKASAG